MKPSDRIIFPLDVASFDEAERFVSLLSPHVGYFKIGLESFIACGPKLVKSVVAYPSRVMLDLKLNDIPETMKRAVSAACRLGVSLITVHANAGHAALKACVEAAGDDAKIAAVTVLTSLDGNDLIQLGMNDRGFPYLLSGDTVLRWAHMAQDAGVNAFVCSPREANSLRLNLNAGTTIITPGIRASGDKPDDQKRTATAQEAVAAGADMLVIGRPIRDAGEPQVAANYFAHEIKAGLDARSA